MDVHAEWDERYAAHESMWSGAPNGVLVSEVDGLGPGRALDVGCGEGADAVWLAGHGWDVVALDVSLVALERARQHAVDAGVEVHWLHSGLLEAAIPAGGFELVSAQYPALLRTPDAAAERGLLDAVAVGGTLLVVHHAEVNREHALEHGWDPDDYVGREQMLSALDDAWDVAVSRRPRHVTTGAGAGHSEDVVLRARRLR